MPIAKVASLQKPVYFVVVLGTLKLYVLIITANINITVVQQLFASGFSLPLVHFIYAEPLILVFFPMRYPVSQPLAQRSKITEIPVWGTEPTPVTQPFCPVTALRQHLEQLPTNQLEIALRLAQENLQASGIRLYIQTDQAIYHCGRQPKKLADGSQRLVEQHLLWQRFLESGDHQQQAGDTELSSDRTWVIANLSSEFRLRTLAAAFKPQEIEQVMIIPLRYGGQMIGCLSVFRDRTLSPWSLAEVVLAQQFSTEFAQTIYDHQLVHKISQAIKARTTALPQDDLKQIISGMIKISISQSIAQMPAALCGVSSRA